MTTGTTPVATRSVLVSVGSAGAASGLFTGGLFTGGLFTGGLFTGRVGTVTAGAAGAGVVLGVVLVLSRWVRSAVTLLIIGVMIGSLATALVSLLLTWTDPQRAQQFIALACAVASHLPGTGATVPLNVITSLIGAPVVITVLLRSRHLAAGAAL